MERIWKDMKRIWRGYGEDIEWRRYRVEKIWSGEDIEWRRYGEDIEWRRYGEDMERI